MKHTGNRNKVVVSIVILLTFILALSGCTKKEDTVLRIGSMPTLSATIYAVGIEKGFFEAENLDVELTIFRSAIERDAAATSGNLDGFMTDMMGAINLYQKDFPFIMTSAEYEDFGIMGMKSFDEYSDVPDVGMSNNTIIEFIMDTYLEIEANKVPVNALPDRLGAMMSGEVDMAIFPQPFIGILMGNGATQLVSTADEGLQPVVMVFDKDLIDSSDKEVEAFYRAYVKAITYMKENDFDDYKEAMVTYGLATEETVDKMRLPIDNYGLSSVDDHSFDQIIAWMKDKDMLDKDISIKEISVNRFVTQ